MKKLPLHNAGFEHLEKGFAQWLDVLGYCQMGVYNMPNNVREFLHYLHMQGIGHIQQLKQAHIKTYYQYLQERPNQRRGGGLSEKYILMQVKTIEKFLEYLRYRGMDNVPALGIRLSAPPRAHITPLSVEEVRELFELAKTARLYDGTLCSAEHKEAMQHRDQAMLVMYYSCGLRRSEAVNVMVEDINLDTRILHVRKGKKYKQRFVPFNKTNAKILQDYIYDYRPSLVRKKSGHNLFLGVRGEPLRGDALYRRLLALQQCSDNTELKEKHIGLHTLRHSIATHLMEAGMEIEHIRKFLGHSSLSSTEIYTHLVKQDSILSS